MPVTDPYGEILDSNGRTNCFSVPPFSNLAALARKKIHELQDKGVDDIFPRTLPMVAGEAEI